jgi:hypothetical protein
MVLCRNHGWGRQTTYCASKHCRFCREGRIAGPWPPEISGVYQADRAQPRRRTKASPAIPAPTSRNVGGSGTGVIDRLTTLP